MSRQDGDGISSSAGASDSALSDLPLEEDALADELPQKRGVRLGLVMLLAVSGLLLVVAGGVLGFFVFGTPKPGGASQTAAASATVEQQGAAGTQNAASASSQPASAAGNAAPAATSGEPGLARVAEFGDWVLTCPPGVQRDPACLLQQQLRSQDTQATVFVWALQRNADGTVRAVWQTPRDVNPQGGLTMDIGDGKPRTLPFKGCNERNCTVSAVVAPEYLQSLQQAQQVTATIVTASTGRATRFGLSARGMSDGLAQLGQAP